MDCLIFVCCGRADRGPKELAQEIEPSQEARDSTQGTPRLDMKNWERSHVNLVKEIAASREKASKILLCLIGV